jgi:hydrogenase/urease accessory protein HupE
VRFKVSISGGLADVLEPVLPGHCTIVGAVRSYVVDDARVQLGEVECPGGLAGHALEMGGLPATQTDALVRVEQLDGTVWNARLTPWAPRAEVAERAGLREVAATYFTLGVEHILLGIDHLLFVLALLLLVRGPMRMVATVTAFTVAHSITLGAATLGVVRAPGTAVETIIALSILFLAAELARGERAFTPTLAVRFPWVVAFAFGLLHGFGFAGAWAEIGVPVQSVPSALFFNVGVEAGQLLFVAAVLAVAALWRRAAGVAPRAWRTAAAYGIGSVAAFWTIERAAAWW